MTPDYGEKDDTVLGREPDLENGKKKSGWTNPHSWHDDGHDDDKVVLQLKEKWRVTPDYGELDPSIMSRERDTANGKKASGWTNPLSWTDDGSDDDRVLLQFDESGFITPADNGLGDESVINFVQTGYDESEGPTKADNGDSDPSVIFRESDIKNGEKFSGWTNPLSWTDSGDDDDTVV